MIRARRVAVVFVAVAISACGVAPLRDGPPATTRPASGDPLPGPEPLSRYGNPPSYEEMGRRYEVLDSAAGYAERGIASWYGTKFHGRRTSSGEPYDMHAMTAAHKTLPLPTWVEVTNLKTRESILVRVNDRGPFIENRIIDLSYEAARRLDIVRDGTGLVEVRALTFDEPASSLAQTVRTESPPEPVAPAADPAAVSASSVPRQAPLEAAPAPEPTGPTGPTRNIPPLMYAQVGAFSDAGNATGLRNRLHQKGFLDAEVHPGSPGNRPVYRVRIGPMVRVEQYDRLTARLNEHGVTEVNLIIE